MEVTTLIMEFILQHRMWCKNISEAKKKSNESNEMILTRWLLRHFFDVEKKKTGEFVSRIKLKWTEKIKVWEQLSEHKNRF